VGTRYKRGVEQRVLNAESARIEAPRGVGFLGGGVSLPSRLGDLGERRELPQRGPGRSSGRQRILGIFQGRRSLPVETMHYGTNQKFGGPGQDLGGLCPLAPA